MLLVPWLLVLLPALAYALRPGEGAVVAPVRLAVVRAALVLGAWAIVTVEAASAFGALTPAAAWTAWSAATAAVGAAAAMRYRRDAADTPSQGARGATRRTWRRTRSAAAAAPAWQWALACVVTALLVGAGVLAVASAPNNFDSQTYHLPRIEHWVQHASVDVFATAIHRQVDLGPGSEYLLTHLRLLSGGDGAYNLVQYVAGLGALLAASRLTAQLGGGPAAQLVTVFILATTPEILLQASSTQVDLVAAAWVACLATVVLDECTRPGERRDDDARAVPTPRSDALYLGLALGLIAITKTTGLLAAAPLLLWWGVARLVRDRRRRARADSGDERAPATAWRARLGTVTASIAVVAIGLAIVGPFLARMQTEFGSPLGPPVLRDSIGVQTADPRLIAVNGLRIAHTALDTPVRPLADAAAAGIDGIARVLGVDVNDRAITFGTSEFPVPSWYPDEDRAAFPLTGLAAIAAGAWFLLKGTGTRRGYAAAVAIAVIGVCCTVAWQPWINRLVQFLVVLGAPMAGVAAVAAAERLVANGRKAAAWAALGGLAAVAALAGVLTVAYGYPRRLTGAWSVFTMSEYEQRFMRRAEWLPQYEQAADAVADSGAATVGLVQGNDSWEYPWWIMLPEGTELVPLQSVVPGHRAGDVADVDAIVCAEDLDECQDLVPEGWRFHDLGTVGYALPPAR